MATAIYETENFVVFEMRGGGMVVRQLRDKRELFFQPGDDAGSVRNSIDALKEVPEGKRDIVFDVAMSDYF